MPSVPISIEVRFLRIPARWTLREPSRESILPTQNPTPLNTSGIPILKAFAERLGEDGRRITLGGAIEALPSERILVPEVVRPIKPKLATEDYGEWRNRFLRLKDEKSIPDFLNEVGVWSAAKIVPENAYMDDMSGIFGFRMFSGRATWMTVGDFRHQQKYWNDLLSDKKALRERFGAPPQEDASPADKLSFASETHFLNEIPLHIEWRKGRPRAIVQPITFREMLATALHLDLLSDAEFQVCQRPDCAISFTGRRRKYCDWYCGHIESVRKNHRKQREKRERELVQARRREGKKKNDNR